MQVRCEVRLRERKELDRFNGLVCRPLRRNITQRKVVKERSTIMASVSLFALPPTGPLTYPPRHTVSYGTTVGVSSRVRTPG